MRYGYYTNYVKIVLRNKGGNPPLPRLDSFVKKSIKTDEDFELFKRELKENDNAIEIIKIGYMCGISYNSCKSAYTEQRIGLLNNFHEDKESYKKYRELESELHRRSRENGNGDHSFKSILIINAYKYFCAKSYEKRTKTQENIFPENSFDEFIEWCLRALEKCGKKYAYECVFDKIDKHFE